MAERGIIRIYLAIVAVTTFAQALIWGVNTLFLLDAGLNIFGVMVANAAFAAGQVVFEVPTGVVADTVGRRVSYLLCVGILLASTLLYVWFGIIQAGLLPFILASVLLGLGYTFFTGAVEAWMVDALAAVGYSETVDPIFARGAIAQGAAMLIGTVGGGFLGHEPAAVRRARLLSATRPAPRGPAAEDGSCRQAPRSDPQTPTAPTSSGRMARDSATARSTSPATDARSSSSTAIDTSRPAAAAVTRTIRRTRRPVARSTATA